MSFKEISKRAWSWTRKPRILGIWAEAREERILISGVIDGQESEGMLTLNQAKALRTLLDVAILKAENAPERK